MSCNVFKQIPDEETEDEIAPDDENDDPAKTGDSTNLTVWIILMAASVVGLSGLGLMRNRNKK